MLRIMLFGSVSVSLCHGETSKVLPLSPQLTALLAFLALGRGREYSRGELLDMLWGEGDASMAPGALNTALWRLRRLIEVPPVRSGEYLSVKRLGHIGLNGPGEIELDSDRFERIVRACLARPLHQLTPRDLDDMRSAAAMYRGDILGELSSAWALRERERLRRLHLDLLGRLMQASAAQGDHEAAIRHAQAILYIDALREDVHRDLMRWYVLNGQRASALRQFETCRAQLRRELAIQPMRETLLLYQRIADSAIAQPELERSLFGPASAPLAATPGAEPTSAGGLWERREMTVPTTSGSNPHIAAARQLLLQADHHLQLSLGFSEH